MRALVLEPRTQPRLRYLIAAFHFRKRVAFGFVELNSGQSRQIRERYQIHPSLDTVLLFNEDFGRPVASVSMSDIPLTTLTNVVSANQYLALPRLSSQEMLEGVCPAEWNRPRKKLCVILITENTETHETARETVRKMALEADYSKDKVRFAYLFKERQIEFVNALTRDEEGLQEALLRLVVIWRRDPTHVKFEWVQEAKMVPENVADFNHTKHKVDDTIQRLLRSTEALSYEAEVQELLDEHAQGMLSKILNKVLITFEYLGDNLGQEHILPAVSVLATVGFILAVGYFMSYLVKLEEEAINKKRHGGGTDKTQQANGGTKTSSTSTANANYVPELKLHELRAEKYNGLVRLLKPGCRTIVLVTDLQSRNKLIPAFHKAVWPYRK